MNLFDFDQPGDARDMGADRRVVDAKESVENEWLERPGVHGVGVYHQRDGSDVIEAWVDTGTDVDALLLPQTVGDVPVIVRVADIPVLSTTAPAGAAAPSRQEGASPAVQADLGRYDPLVGGIAMCPLPAIGQGYGTLGMVVADPGSGVGAPVAMTAAHVLVAAGSPLNSQLSQPGTTHQLPDVFGAGVRGHLGNYPVGNVPVGIDVGVGSTPHRASALYAIANLFAPVSGSANPQVGMQVEKRGATTVVTQGQITHVNTVQTYMVNGTLVRLDNQFGVDGGTAGPFGAPGDSGSIVLVGTPTGPHAVGMVVMGTAGPPPLTWCSPWSAIGLYMANS